MRTLSKYTIAIFSFMFCLNGNLDVFASIKAEPKTEAGKRHYEIAKQTELESVVLLENRGGFLPLNKMKQGKVAVFGNGAFAPTNGSSGSGTVSGAFTYNLFEGLDSIGVGYEKSVCKYYSENIKVSYMYGFAMSTINHNWDTSDKKKWGEPRSSNSGWNMTSPIANPELNLKGEMVRSAANFSSDKTAIVYITRGVGTEEMDRFDQPSDWYLNPSEYTLLKQVTRDFDNVVVVLNTSGSLDLSWMDFKWLAKDPDYNDGGTLTESDAKICADKIKGLILTYGSGSYHGLVVAKLLYGEEDFSGKLADSMTKTYDKHPAKDNFHYKSYADKGLNYRDFNSLNGKDDPIYLYQEGIFTGYRYFDTFAAKDVLYPFGYGLSYNKYAFENLKIEANKKEKVITVSATIKNITSNTSLPAGKEVMEVYISAPEGKLEQPYQKLIDYNKTQKLEPGKEETIKINIPISDLASYSEEKAAYILEPGDYIIRVGNSSRNTHIAGVLNVDKEIVVEQLSNKLTLNGADPLGKANNQSVYNSICFSTKAKRPSDPSLAGYLNPNDSKELKKVKPVLINAEYVDYKDSSKNIKAYRTGKAPVDHVATLTSVKNGEISLHDFVAQMTKDELVNFLSGGYGTRNSEQYYTDDKAIQINNLTSKDATKGWVGGAGSSRNIRRLGIPSATYADGSAGISIDEKNATQLGIDRNPGYARAAGIACTWNPMLQYEWGKAIGEEMRLINVDIWLAPSVNLHRNPLNGRNTEYYSEDPILSGKIAKQATKGVAESGVTVCLKHFAGNDQEWFRRGLHTAESEAKGNSKDAANTIVSERSLREITLKPFEIAVKSGDAMCVMAAFNKINGKYCATSTELLTDILRGEWSFNGYVVTDWGDFDEIPHAADEMRSGTDMIMSGLHNRFSIPAQIYNGVVNEFTGKSKTVSLAQLQRNAANVLQTILSSRNAFDGNKQYNHQTQMVNKLEILTTQLPISIVGLDYSTIKVNPIIVSGSEGTRSYTISLDKSGASLPPSLKLYGNGSIVGTPTSAEIGTYNLVIKVEDDKGNVSTKPLTLVVDNIALVTGELPVARLKMNFEAQFKGFEILGGTPPYTFEVSKGSLPSGLSVESNGKIKGMPDAIGIAVFSVKVADSKGNSIEKGYSLKVEDVINVSLTPNSPITNAQVNNNINISISANRTGFNDAYEYEFIGAPEWLKISKSWFGTSISGVPTATGEYGFKILVKVVGSSVTHEVPYQISVSDGSNAKLEISTNQLPAGEVNKPYAATLTSMGGVGVKSFELEAGSDHPKGLSLSKDGTINWTPAGLDFGYYNLKIKVKDQKNNEVTKVFALHIKGSLTINPADNSELKAKVGEPFKTRLNVSGGTVDSFNYSLSSKADQLPKGVSFKDGIFRGTPSVNDVGNYNIIIRVSENGGSFSGSEVKYRITITK